MYSAGNYTVFDPPGAINSGADGINNSGQIVGYFVDSSGTTHGFLDVGGNFTSIDVPGAITTGPIGINDRGQIVGFFVDSSGQNHGFLATPQNSNTSPTVNAGSDATTNEGATFTRTGSFTDPDPDTWTATVNYSDGSGVQPLALNADKTFNLNHVYADGPNSYTVTVTVTDSQGGVGSGTFAVNVLNVPPVAMIGGPADGVRGQERDFTFSATDVSLPDQNAGFTYSINWGDGSPALTLGPTAGNAAGVSVGHVFTSEGVYTVQVTATDKDGGVSDVVSQQVSISKFELQADPVYPGKTMLVIGGTTGNDQITLVEFPGLAVGLRMNNQLFLIPDPTSRIVVYGQAGNDFIDGRLVFTPEWLHGDDDNDVLLGGFGNDVLLGGLGDDRLDGGFGRNLLIGGTGADVVGGPGGDDILIAGYTDFDRNDAALAAIMAEWSSAHTYLQRVANLSGVGSPDRLNGNVFLLANGFAATVHSDTSVDQLNGGGQDWFFADLDGPFRDRLRGYSRGEIVEDIDPPL